MQFVAALGGSFLLLLLFFISWLPRRWALALGAGLGGLLYRLMPYRRRVCAQNLAWAFPDWTPAAREALLRRHFRSLGQGFMEMGFAWFYPRWRLEKMCRLEADPAALAALNDPKQGVVLLGCHATLLELGVRLLGLYVRANGMYRPIRQRFFDRWIKYQRERAASGIPLVHFKDLRGTLAVLQQGGNLWYAIDQDMGPKVSVFVPFFGLETASINILPQLQKRTGALLVPVMIWREAAGYVVRLQAPVQGADAVAIMTEVNGRLEAEIRRQPEQYYWLHRRFKSLPDGSRRSYE